MFKNLRIGTKLIAVGTVLIVIPLAVVTILAVEKSALAITGIETEQLGRAARLIARTIDSVFVEEQKTASAKALDKDVIDAAVAAGAAPAGSAAKQDTLRRVTEGL